MIAQAGFIQVQNLNQNGNGITAIGGNTPPGAFRAGPKGKVALRVEGDLEVTGDMPRVVHVSKCEVQCIVNAEPLICPPPAFPWVGFTIAVVLSLAALVASKVKKGL